MTKKSKTGKSKTKPTDTYEAAMKAIRAEVAAGKAKQSSADRSVKGRS
jgi:hypothetical protein